MTQNDINNAFDNYYKVDSDHLADCEHIQTVATGMGVSISLSQASIIWGRWSDTFSAGWLMLGDDSTIQDAINSFVNIHS